MKKINFQFEQIDPTHPDYYNDCDGGCEDHSGRVKQVEVTGNGCINPWYFNYCDSAEETDKLNGFTVKRVESEIEQ